MTEQQTATFEVPTTRTVAIVSSAYWTLIRNGRTPVSSDGTDAVFEFDTLESVTVGGWRYNELLAAGYTPVTGPVVALPDPFPQYTTLGEVAGAVEPLRETVEEGRLSEAALSATRVLGPTYADMDYDSDGNLLTWTQDGLAASATYDLDGNVHTITVAGVTRTFTYDTDGNLIGAS